jgi:hypothetical protein
MSAVDTHSAASLYAAFPPPEARRLAEKLEFHYTPKHGVGSTSPKSNSARSRASHRIPSLEAMRTQVHSWATARNNRHSTIDWQFTTADARIKPKHVYPQLVMIRDTSTFASFSEVSTK